MNLRPYIFGSCAMLAGLLGMPEQAHAKQHKKFKLERTKNVGYPQDELPTHVLVDGQPNPCYFQVGFLGSHSGNTIHHGSAVEPSIAVNPQNPLNIVACWQQDRIRNGGSLEAGIAYTFDGGKSWKRTEVPFQLCNEGINQRVSDVWLSFASDGKLYLASLAFNVTVSQETQNQDTVSVSISVDGGKTWSLPQEVSASNFVTDPRSGSGHDKPSITADPNHKNNAYATWSGFIPNGFSFYGPTFFSRTTDGGKTWSNSTVSYAGNIESSIGELLYDPFADLCAQGLSTCDRNFFSAQSGEPGDSGIESFNNIIVVLPEATPSDKKWRKDTWGNDKNKAKRFSGHLLNGMWRFYPSFDVSNMPGGDALFAEEEFNYFNLITFFYFPQDIALVRSQDQGANWNVTATIIVPNTDFAGNAGAVFIAPEVYTGGYNYDVDGNPTTGNGSLIRTGFVEPSFAVNPKNGFLYTAYQSGQFRSDFLPQIGITTSRDGGYTWSERVLINRTPQDAPNPQAFTPFVAVTEDGYVGVLYSDFRNDPASVPNTNSQTLTDTWLAIYKEVDGPGSTGIGLDFVQEIRLSKHSYIAQNGPTTSQGVMTNGDYSFLVANKHNFYASFTESHNGPFTPNTLFYDNPDTDTQIFLDDNYRQSPYVSIVKPVKDDSSSSSSSSCSTHKHKR
jgi:hypothetical protein